MTVAGCCNRAKGEKAKRSSSKSKQRNPPLQGYRTLTTTTATPEILRQLKHKNPNLTRSLVTFFSCSINPRSCEHRAFHQHSHHWQLSIPWGVLPALGHPPRLGAPPWSPATDLIASTSRGMEEGSGPGFTPHRIGH